VMAGFRTLRDRPPARLVVVVITAGYAVIGALDVLTVGLAVSVLDIGDSGAGYLVAAVGAGGVIGSVASTALVGRRRLAPALVGSALVCGAALIVLAGVTDISSVFALLVIIGMSRSVLGVAGNTLLQRSTPPTALARVFALVEGFGLIGLAAGAIIVPILVSAGGSESAFVGVGLILPAIMLLRFRRVLQVDRSATVPVVELALLRRMRIFASLPAPAIEGLARSAEPLEVPAGEYIIREGELGDRYYAIADGEVQIRRGGVDVSRRARGDGIGEIALLHNVPRTADVIALVPTRLFVLDRTAFVVALTGHGPARVEADRIIDDYEL
jgi:MFS family permease